MPLPAVFLSLLKVNCFLFVKFVFPSLWHHMILLTLQVLAWPPEHHLAIVITPFQMLQSKNEYYTNKYPFLPSYCYSLSSLFLTCSRNTVVSSCDVANSALISFKESDKVSTFCVSRWISSSFSYYKIHVHVHVNPLTYLFV